MIRRVLATEVSVESEGCPLSSMHVWCDLLLECGHRGHMQYPWRDYNTQHYRRVGGRDELLVTEEFFENPDPPGPVPLVYDCERCDACARCGFQKGTLVQIGREIVDIDTCLAAEVLELNQLGVTTIGCCCRHGERGNGPFISIEGGESLVRARELGYELDRASNSFSDPPFAFIEPKRSGYDGAMDRVEEVNDGG